MHRFYQMWQELDCDASKTTRENASGCQADLFPWVEETVSSGSNGNPTPKPLAEGDIAMGFYNVANGDAPYLTELARTYTLNDNYHQGAMGGTYANHMMIGYADALYYADTNGDPATPNHVLVPGSNPPVYVNEIENPNPAPGTNNWYANDGYSGGSYTNCSDYTQPGVAPIVNYLSAVNVPTRCAPNAYYLLNNYVPSYIGSGQTDPINNGPFTLPPVIKQRHIGDALHPGPRVLGVFRRALERLQDRSRRGCQLRVARPGRVSVLQYLQPVPLFRVGHDQPGGTRGA